ncbi:hypothetical protein AURDEDRAFT_163722 [Auricularia subglabra TFB-10046 SS5]|nr:hypothetical protein AURDEDRAFT_163722 [Auricularia subglabra TFB-10046 SS5]
MTVPPDYSARASSCEARIRLLCATLAELTSFALDTQIDNADSRCIAFLAHALGLLCCANKLRASLVLVSSELPQPGARTLLDETVSERHMYAFAGWGSRRDYDEGLWDHNL